MDIVSDWMEKSYGFRRATENEQFGGFHSVARFLTQWIVISVRRLEGFGLCPIRAKPGMAVPKSEGSQALLGGAGSSSSEWERPNFFIL